MMEGFCDGLIPATLEECQPGWCDHILVLSVEFNCLKGPLFEVPTAYKKIDK